ncbi:3-oxoacyl-[acyl-carrier-protein] synthase III C-terminal domain-containing protein [Nocardia sp. NPDC051463]|uniref:3-oxoacyl-[acyl-carrier-protein] synthase III C-terminal domain-containing protein n=1 Tax=Nocardia sp. NPDC051463 TaxID=3154845 RepID=UPI0034338E65
MATSNRRLIEQLIGALGIAANRRAINVDRYGNTSGAGILILLAENVRIAVIGLGAGDPIVIAAVGANLHSGAHFIRL